MYSWRRLRYHGNIGLVLIRLSLSTFMACAQVWNLKRRQLIGKLVGLTGLASSLQFFRAADTLMSADLGGKVVIWKITAGKQEQVLLHPQAPQQSVRISRASTCNILLSATSIGRGDEYCVVWNRLCMHAGFLRLAKAQWRACTAMEVAASGTCLLRHALVSYRKKYV